MSKPQGKAGPSKPYGRPQKPIHKTIDLLKKNQAAAAKGKGKENEVLGGVMSLVDEVKRLPGMISVEKFAQTRAMEIHAFQTAIKTAAAQGSTRAFQSLPRHLRRRAASHNPRRVPKRLRSRAAAEIDAGDTIAKKHRKIAKLRAKGNLRDRLSRTAIFRIRQRSKRWLPTHIWHAKRYHMANIWGWRLPITPTLKSFRPAYRAGKRKAIAWDMSYYGVIEVEGLKEEIVKLLTGVTFGKFAGDKFENGSRVAEVLVYQPESFPRGLIGPAEILWQPLTQDKSPHNDARRIWIRVHPSIFDQVFSTLKAVSGNTLAEENLSKRVQALQLRDLRGELESFEIMGPKSGEVLRRVLRLCKSEKGVKSKFFDALGDPAEVPSRTIVGLNVHDPRLHFPPPRIGEHEESLSNDGVLRSSDTLPSPELAQSVLWDPAARELASEVMYTKYQLDARRHKLGMPGTRLHPTSSDNRIPLILFHRSTRPPSSPTPESFHGFTLLFPSSWAQYLLTSIAYTGTLIGGLNERKVQHREAGTPSFPEHFGQVCVAGEKWEKSKAEEAEKRWERKPPAKRVAFDKLGTSRPWIPDWSTLMGQGTTTLEEAALNGEPSTHPYLLPHPFTAHLEASLTPSKLLKNINTFRSQRGLSALPSVRQAKLFREAVLHVELNVVGRGSPGDMAVICGLTEEERKAWIGAYEGDGDEFGLAGEISELQRLGEVRAPEKNLIGYTSTGNISLSRGKGHALGMITLAGYLDLLKAANGEVKGSEWDGKALVCVRNRDGRIARLAEVRVAC
ncbi:ribonuclease P/MRP protein subunit POP1 [Cryptococcus neoformans Bt120]|nr:ribonuclease P/MRP protein subunit POP1 [Cryptococcus neoformans var. grubii Bt15]OXG36408.1 ribonuclease P/MRP protein subunit POP1 [Cryptococcus neoformans var. grubii Bt120]